MSPFIIPTAYTVFTLVFGWLAVVIDRRTFGRAGCPSMGGAAMIGCLFSAATAWAFFLLLHLHLIPL